MNSGVGVISTVYDFTYNQGFPDQYVPYKFLKIQTLKDATHVQCVIVCCGTIAQARKKIVNLTFIYLGWERVNIIWVHARGL